MKKILKPFFLLVIVFIMLSANATAESIKKPIKTVKKPSVSFTDHVSSSNTWKMYIWIRNLSESSTEIEKIKKIQVYLNEEFQYDIVPGIAIVSGKANTAIAKLIPDSVTVYGLELFKSGNFKVKLKFILKNGYVYEKYTDYFNEYGFDVPPFTFYTTTSCTPWNVTVKFNIKDLFAEMIEGDSVYIDIENVSFKTELVKNSDVSFTAAITIPFSDYNNLLGYHKVTITLEDGQFAESNEYFSKCNPYN